jgi:NADH-quinone oxidoreductase subunit J
MTGLQIVFFIIAVVTIFAGLMAVTASNLVHAALWLIVSLFGIALSFALLNAGFLAVAQIIVYIGAIAILVIFAIMLTRRVASDASSQINSGWPWAAAIALVLFGGLIWMLREWTGFNSLAQPMSPRTDPLSMLGMALVSPNAYVIPFEVASVLLLAALIGAIIIAWERK